MELATQILGLICIVLGIALILILLWQNLRDKKIHVADVDTNDFSRYFESEKGQQMVRNIIQRNNREIERFTNTTRGCDVQKDSIYIAAPAKE